MRERKREGEGRERVREREREREMCVSECVCMRACVSGLAGSVGPFGLLWLC